MEAALAGPLPPAAPVRIVAFGKAVLGMVVAACAQLGDRVVGGVACVPVGAAAALKAAHPGLECPVTIHEGAANNLPDAAAQAETQKKKKKKI